MKHFLFVFTFFGWACFSFTQTSNEVFKQKLEITKTEPLKLISTNDSLNSEYKLANNLNYSAIDYKSDSQDVNSDFNELTLNYPNKLKVSETKKRTKIAITIDDVPNTRKFKSDNYYSILKEKLDSINIPITIFINEGLIYKIGDTVQNKKLLDEWAKREYITLGNHTYSHLRYSNVKLDEFKRDIERGEYLTRQLANKYNKPLQYFRFPYNDLGIDSISQTKMDSLLTKLNYKIAPFTIESSDWMFNAVYEYHISNSNLTEAAKIGELYVSKTIDYIHFFDSVSLSIYGRNMNQIYLCHDNSINANYLKEIIKKLELENYVFVSMEDAMKDPAYEQANNYYKKWGISWIYRWIKDSTKRMDLMKKEPDISEVEKLYNTIVK